MISNSEKLLQTIFQIIILDKNSRSSRHCTGMTKYSRNSTSVLSYKVSSKFDQSSTKTTQFHNHLLVCSLNLSNSKQPSYRLSPFGALGLGWLGLGLWLGLGGPRPSASACASVSGILVPRVSGCVSTSPPASRPITPNIIEGRPGQYSIWKFIDFCYNIERKVSR